jgi:hypothetical protein
METLNPYKNRFLKEIQAIKDVEKIKFEMTEKLK